MHAHTPAILALLVYVAAAAGSDCRPEERHNGCKIVGTSCVCGYGCNTDYIYPNRRECQIELKGRNSNICLRSTCLRGICIQTSQESGGFTCKCEGTGFYGRRCERACPTIPMPGRVFPHECVVI